MLLLLNTEELLLLLVLLFKLELDFENLLFVLMPMSFCWIYGKSSIWWCEEDCECDVGLELFKQNDKAVAMRPDDDFKLLLLVVLVLVEVDFSFWFVPIKVNDEDDAEDKSVFCWSSVQIVFACGLLFWDEISSS